MKTMLIHDEDYQKARKLLEENGISVDAPSPAIRPGKLNTGDKPADFGGIWVNDERTLSSIRENAWPKRN